MRLIRLYGDATLISPDSSKIQGYMFNARSVRVVGLKRAQIADLGSITITISLTGF